MAARAAVGLARRLEEKGDFKAARTAYREAIELAGGPDKAPEAVSRLRTLQTRLSPERRDLEGLVALGPDIPAVFKLEPDPDIDMSPAVASPSLIDLRVANISVLVGSGELETAETIATEWCSEEEKSQWGPAPWPFVQLAQIRGQTR